MGKTATVFKDMCARASARKRAPPGRATVHPAIGEQHVFGKTWLAAAARVGGSVSLGPAGGGSTPRAPLQWGWALTQPRILRVRVCRSGKACNDLLTKDYKVGKTIVEVKSKTPSGVVRAWPRWHTRPIGCCGRSAVASR